MVFLFMLQSLKSGLQKSQSIWDLDEDLAPVISASVRSVSTQEGRRAWIDAARTLPKGHRLRAAVREGLS